MDRIMERVEQESSRMGGLVEDMLVLARLDQQRPIERRPVDLLTLTADAVQDARIVAPSRSIDLTVGTGAAFLVLGDEARLRQVISNLMNNALTHTPDGSPISVRIFTGYQRGNPVVPCAILEVTDHGPGLTRSRPAGSSSASTGPTRHGAAAPAAAGLAWRSSRRWSPRTAGPSAWTPRPGTAPRSVSPSRWPPKRWPLKPTTTEPGRRGPATAARLGCPLCLSNSIPSRTTGRRGTAR